MTHRRNTIRRSLFAALAITAACAAYTHDTNACGGGWEMDPQVELHYREIGIASAEKQLQEGRYDDAAGTVLRVIPHIAVYKAPPGDPVISRALRVLAVSTARQSGKFDIDKQLPEYLQASWLGKDKTETDKNLEWAVNTLRAINKTKKDDAVAQSDLGEALAKVDAHHAEARKILEKLAKKDLLTSPEAYKALATLRAADGDKSGRSAALERCRAMAKDAKICKATAQS